MSWEGCRPSIQQRIDGQPPSRDRENLVKNYNDFLVNQINSDDLGLYRVI